MTLLRGLMHAFTGENIPFATSIYLFVSNVPWLVIAEMCITVTLSLLPFTKMMLLSALEAGRQLHFLTYVPES